MVTNLKTIREHKQLTQSKLAELSKVDQTYISELERGDKTNPSLDILNKLASALGVSISDLIGKAS